MPISQIRRGPVRHARREDEIACSLAVAFATTSDTHSARLVEPLGTDVSNFQAADGRGLPEALSAL